MRKMSFARQLKVQKMQDKNRMVGQTFNTSGITSQQISSRESFYIKEWSQKTEAERLDMYNKFKAVEDWKDRENLHFSNSWEQNVFMSNFRYQFEKPNIIIL